MRVEPFPEDGARVEHLDGASLERGLVSHTARLDCFLHGWGRKEVGGVGLGGGGGGRGSWE